MADSSLDRAKRPRTALAGPYGHPFHPVLVTIPIGAWVASFVFDLAAIFSDRETVFAEGAYWLIGLGIVGALLAAVFGLLDLVNIPRGTRVFKTGLAHMALNLTAVAVFAVDFGVRAAGDQNESSPPALLLSLVGLGLVSASGYLGGALSYHYGVRVADELTQREGYQ